MFFSDNLSVQIKKSKYIVAYGDHVTLETHFFGGPPATSFVWTKHNNTPAVTTIVPEKNKYIWLPAANEPSLIILRAEENDSGTYTCVATRKNGTTVQSPDIHVFVEIVGVYV